LSVVGGFKGGEEEEEEEKEEVEYWYRSKGCTTPHSLLNT